MAFKDLAQLKDCFSTKRIFCVEGGGVGALSSQLYSVALLTFHLLVQPNICNNKEREVVADLILRDLPALQLAD